MSFFSFTAGHVGPPLPCNKIKLVDVPEMECYAKDGKVEVRMSLFFFQDMLKTRHTI